MVLNKDTLILYNKTSLCWRKWCRLNTCLGSVAIMHHESCAKVHTWISLWLFPIIFSIPAMFWSDSWDDRNFKLQAGFSFITQQSTYSSRYAVMQICANHLEWVISLFTILDKNRLSLKESCLCAELVGQINELSIHDRKPWALIKLAGCTNTRPVSLFPSSVGGWNLEIK